MARDPETGEMRAFVADEFGRSTGEPAADPEPEFVEVDGDTNPDERTAERPPHGATERPFA